MSHVKHRQLASSVCVCVCVLASGEGHLVLSITETSEPDKRGEANDNGYISTRGRSSLNGVYIL